MDKKQATKGTASLKDVRIHNIPVFLDKERSLRYDLNAFAEVERHYDTMTEAFAAMRKGSMAAVRCLAWAGLVHEDESLTLRDVGATVNMDNIGILTDAVLEAMGNAVPDAEEAPAAEAENDPM